ncbi:ATP-binding protein [Candidatus Bathyarchaeota archaeon]|nr:ATP-binding protein [Candidatus Bathyarchaeota archaeon]MBS7630869.1 ATP-binding protein [Candidatus Bathyarchaeota archaeon]
MSVPESQSFTEVDETERLRILYVHNPWWTTGRVPEAKAQEFKRRDYYMLLKTLYRPEIVAVVGARRVGKTTLMYQLIDYVIGKVGPERAMYISLDDPYLKINADSLRTIFDLYAKNVLKEPFSEIKNSVYIFLDEVQSLVGWDQVLKRWFDLGYKAKFYVSGSSSVNILTGGAESLVGRLSPQIVMPMKFLETVRFHMKEEDFERRFNHVNWRLKDALLKAVEEGDVTIFYSSLRENANALAGDIDRIHLFLQSYLIKGGYPEIVSMEDLPRASETLRNYFNLTIYKDIVRTFKIRDPVAFEELISILARECCQRFNYSRLARTLDLRRETLKAYLFYLKTAFLICESEYYSRSLVKRSRREKKIYINDPGIRNVAVGAMNEYLLRNPAELGRVVEGVVADHCKRLKFNLEPSYELQLFYWKSQGCEVDIVMELLQKPVPVEVKYRDSFDEKDMKGLNMFNESHEPPLSLVVTKERLDLQGKTILIPLWLFLLLC